MGIGKECTMSRSVVVGIDGSRGSLAAGEWAAREATLLDIPLRLVHAAPPPHSDVAELPPALTGREAGTDVLHRAEADLRTLYPHLAVSSVEICDSPAAALLAASEEAEFVAVGARGEGGFDGLSVGSTALAVASTASCSVAVVPQRSIPVEEAEEDSAAAVPRAVVVGVDVRHVADPPLDHAFASACRWGTPLRAVYAWALPAASPLAPLGVPEEDRAEWEDEQVQRLADVLQGWQEKYPQVTALLDVLLLHPAQALVTASHRAGLLVLGRRSALRVAERKLGPVAHAVLHHACCPVVIVPHV
jgi:nucleotide-binding universal stress UspA family protein